VAVAPEEPAAAGYRGLERRGSASNAAYYGRERRIAGH
jgi:hypothetical protein